MRIMSFNVNGIRARPHQLQEIKDKYDPDIIGLQETKVQDQEFPLQMVNDIGYEVIYFGQKSHYGVSILSKKLPLKKEYGFPDDDEDSQRRIITGTFLSPLGSEITIINGYFPQGENQDHETKFPKKRQFFSDLQSMLDDKFQPSDNLMIIGDINIAPTDNDIGIGAENKKLWLKKGKCSFLPQERAWMDRLLKWGLYDTFRTIYPNENMKFSWFDYRSRGFDREPRRGLRIDFLLATNSLNKNLIDAGIAYDIRAMNRPSDHAPVWVDIDI
tara:strand:+ start:1573 stop:2388 length:816 start_codon:yes stop_codon:yes gene_type:complete